MRISDWSSDVCSYDLGKSELRRLKIDRSLVDPTDDEIHDNIVAFWVPRDAAEAGKRYRLRYRLHWQEIGRASCRERVSKYVSISVVVGSLKKKVNISHV